MNLKHTKCSVCGAKHLSRGLCQRHYNEARRSGQFTESLYVRGTPAERLAALSVRDERTGCLLWTGNKNTAGYGRVSIGDQSFLAHRVAYAVSVGPVPDEMLVCHRCDTPACIEPTHLFLGTNTDNMADKVTKGRQSRGEDGPATLTEAEVVEIRADQRTQRAIAKAYGISQQQVSFIKRYAEWTHLPLSEADRAAIAERQARLAKGQRFSHCKLTPDDVRAIRQDSRSDTKIAADYGVAFSLIYRIKRRQSWKHVD